MNIRSFTLDAALKVAAIMLVLSVVASGAVHAANYPLEIIQPRPGLDTKNRFYKAYPELEYNVRVAVTGGDYPYRYELVSGPADMRINGRGEITWPSPAAPGSPHEVSVAVSDAAGRSQTVSWSITVTTEGFRFIDAVNGTPAASGGTGTISNPWRTMRDLFEGDDYDAKRRDSYAGEFVYWRNGTYALDAYKEGCPSECRVPFVGGFKPIVWLAYPGERPVFNLNTSGHDAYLIIYGGGSDNVYFDGLQFDLNGNRRGMGIQIDSNANHVTIRRTKAYGITTGATGGNNALVFISRSSRGRYYSLQDNEWSDVNCGYGVLGYSAAQVLIEDNELHHIGSSCDSHPIGPKEGTASWHIRGNFLHDNPRDSIGLQYSNSNGLDSGDIEISYNLVLAGGGMVRINSNQTTSGLPVYVYRNTFMDDVEVLRATAANGPFYLYENVIVNNSSAPDKIRLTNIEDQSHVVISDNLAGSPSDNIVDDQGNLTSAYSSFIGSRGYQIGTQLAAPRELKLAIN